MDKMVALPETELRAREDDENEAGIMMDELNHRAGLMNSELIAAGYSYLRTVRDRRLCKICDAESDKNNPLAFMHPLS